MATSAPRPAWRKLFDDLDTEVSRALAETRETTRRELAETLNQAVRRLRQAENADEAAATLAETSVRFCRAAAVFRVEAGAARSVAARGDDRLASLAFDLAEGAAFVGAVESKEPVIAMCTEREI